MLYIKELIIMILLALVVAGNLTDVIYDYREGASLAHLAIEIGLVVTSFSLIAFLSFGIWSQSRSNRKLKAELSSLEKDRQAELPPEVAAARHSLAKVIQGQFETWQLTVTEKEVAMLLLKGLSFKEIAAVRDTMEKTVRQQASSIYRKASVSGRHEFAAWFIEDYL